MYAYFLLICSSVPAVQTWSIFDLPLGLIFFHPDQKIARGRQIAEIGANNGPFLVSG
jgi:hypothetical protein